MTGENRAHSRQIVVMGVSASGKSSVGLALAERRDAEYVDADDLHPQANVDKMAAGIPLDDDDRAPWLDATAARLAAPSRRGGIVLACSALKRAYRDRLRASAPRAVFVHLTGSPELLLERAEARQGHYMPASLLQSQLDTLEALDDDEAGFSLDFSRPVGELIEEAEEKFQ